MDGTHTLIVGKTGSGKSVLARELVKRYYANNRNHFIIIVNPKPVKTGWDVLIPANKSDLPRLYNGIHLNWRVPIYAEDNIEELLENVYKKKWRGLIVYDEGQELKPKRYFMPDVIYRQGREMGISTITLCQRPVDITRYAITQATDFYIFNILGKNDTQILNDYLEIDLSNYLAPAQGTRVAKKLPKFHYLHYNNSTGNAIVESCAMTRDEILRKPFTLIRG